MTDMKAWIEERLAEVARAKRSPNVLPGSPTANYVSGQRRIYEAKAGANLPRALDALEAVNVQVDRMEADANTYGDGGHDLACDALFAYVVTLRDAIESALEAEE